MPADRETGSRQAVGYLGALRWGGGRDAGREEEHRLAVRRLQKPWEEEEEEEEEGRLRGVEEKTNAYDTSRQEIQA